MTSLVKQNMLAELAQRESEIREELREIKQLRAAIKAVGDPLYKDKNSNSSSREKSGPTFKQMIVAVLKKKGEGAQAIEILDLIKEEFGKEIKRSSLSPQLSRLKSEGIILLDDTIWHLPNQRIVPNMLPVQKSVTEDSMSASASAVVVAASSMAQSATALAADAYYTNIKHSTQWLKATAEERDEDLEREAWAERQALDL